jgi:O-antigen/teichoic acid export membrane protein
MTSGVDERVAAPREPSVSGWRRIVSISASLVSTQAVTSVLGLAFWTVAAHQSSVSSVGVAGAAVALMQLLASFGTLGLGTLLISRFPQTEQAVRRLLVRTSLAIAGTAAAVLAFVVPWLAIHGFGADNLRLVAGNPVDALGLVAGTALMAVTIVLDQAVLVLGAGSLQLERNIVSSAVKLVAVIVLGYLGHTAGMAIFLAWTIGNAVSLPVVAWRTRGGRALQASRRLLDVTVLRGLGRAAASHHALNIALQAPLQILPVIVTVLLSARDNAYFSSANLVTVFVFALPYAMSIGLFAAADGDEREVLRRMRFTVPFGLAVSLAADLVLWPLARFVLHLFGSAYAAGATDTLRVLVLAGLPFVIRDHFIALRRVQGRTTQAVGLIAGFTVFELGGAVIGAEVGGTVGLCAVWVGVLFVEAVLLAVPLLRAVRALPPEIVAESLAADGPPSGHDREPGGTAVRRAVAMASRVWPIRLPAARLRRRDRAADVGGPGIDLSGPMLTIMAAGLVAIALAARMARTAGSAASSADGLYVVGLVALFVPPTLRILYRRTPHRERLVLAVALPIQLQISRILLYPTHVAYHDELIHANVLRQIGNSHHLFTDNPLLPVTAYYPGLEVASDAVHQISGLSEFVSGLVVLLLARVVLALAVIGVIRALTGSVRAACVASVVYVCNSQMFFFNSQYSYQTLALPLAALTLYVTLTRTRGRRRSLLLPVAAMIATALTHHLTSMLLVLALLIWLALEVVFHGRRSVDARDLAVVTGAGILAVVLAILNPGNPVLSYLYSIGAAAGDALTSFFHGQQSKVLFQDSAGTPTPAWQEDLTLAAVVLVALVLIPALLRARVWFSRRIALAVLLCLVAIIYPVIPAGHLTRSTAEVGDRSAGFVFFGVAFVLGWWSTRHRLRLAPAVIVSAFATVVFLGNIVLGTGPVSEQLPGPYLVSADARSIDADNLAAARWLAANNPPETRIYADRVAGLLDAAIGGQYTVLHVSTGIDASRVLLDPDFSGADVRLIQQARISYVVVDLRDATGLPHEGVYIENGEYGGTDRTKPVPLAALTKLSRIPGVRRVYDNGALVIYDVRALLTGPVTGRGPQPTPTKPAPAPTSTRPPTPAPSQTPVLPPAPVQTLEPAPVASSGGGGCLNEGNCQ